MKRLFAFLSVSLLVISFQTANAYDLSEDDLEEIGNEDPGEPGGEEPNPLLCNGFDDSAAPISKECKSLMANHSKLQLLNNGSAIQNFSGNFKGKSGHVVLIQNTKGNLVLLGLGDAYIEQIKDTKGNLTICNMDVGIVESVSSGNIHIDGGNVCKISGHKGNVKINGRVGEVSNNKGNIEVNGSVDSINSNKGNIKVINGNVGDINGHTGNLRVINGTVTGTVTNTKGNIKIGK